MNGTIELLPFTKLSKRVDLNKEYGRAMSKYSELEKLGKLSKTVCCYNPRISEYYMYKSKP